MTGELLKTQNQLGQNSKIKINLKKKPDRLHQSSIYKAFAQKERVHYSSCHDQYQDAISMVFPTSKVVRIVNMSPTVTFVSLAENIHKDLCTGAHAGLCCRNYPLVSKDGGKFLVKFSHELMAISFFNKYEGKYDSEEKNMTFEEESSDKQQSDTSVYSVELSGRLESIYISSVSMEMFKVRQKCGNIVKSPFLFSFYSLHGSFTRKVVPMHLLQSEQETLDQVGMRAEGGNINIGDQNIMEEEGDSVSNVISNIVNIIKKNLKQFSEKGQFDRAIVMFENWDDANIFIDLVNLVEMGDIVKNVLYCIGVLPTMENEPVLDCPIKLFGYHPKICATNINQRNVLINAMMEKFIRLSFSSLETLLGYAVAVESIKSLICKEVKSEIYERKTQDSPVKMLQDSNIVIHNFTENSQIPQKIPQSLKFLRWSKVTCEHLKNPNLLLLSLKTTHVKSIRWVSAISIFNMVTNTKMLDIAILPNYISNILPTTGNNFCQHCSQLFPFHWVGSCPSQYICLRCPNQPPHTLSSCSVDTHSCWNCGEEHSWRNCPEEILTSQQKVLYKAGYRFSVSNGQLVCTFLTEDGEIPCMRERETIRRMSVLFQGGINIFLGYNVYEVVMELLKFVTMNFSQNNFFISLVHGMIDLKWLLPNIKEETSLKSLITITSGKPSPALDTPSRVCKQINTVLKDNYNFDLENVSYLCNNFAVISSTFLTNYTVTDTKNTKLLTEEDPNKTEITQANLEELIPQRSMFEVYSFVYLYVTWKAPYIVLAVKIKAISKFREKHFTAKLYNLEKTLEDFRGYMLSNSDFFPNLILVSVCPDGLRVFDKTIEVMVVPKDIFNLFVGHFDLYSASELDIQHSLKSLKTEDKSRVEALFKTMCNKTCGEYQSVLWSMQEIHLSVFKKGNYLDIPFFDVSECLKAHFSCELFPCESIVPVSTNSDVKNQVEERTTTLEIKDEKPIISKLKETCVTQGRPIETHVSFGLPIGGGLSTQTTVLKSKTPEKYSAMNYSRSDESGKTKEDKRRTLYGGNSFVYFDLELERVGDHHEITFLKIKADSKYREKYFRASGRDVKKALERMIVYLHKNKNYPKPICITTGEGEQDDLTTNLKQMGLFQKFGTVFTGWFDLSGAVDQLQNNRKYKAFSRSGRNSFEKDYACVFGRLIGDHQTSIWTMKELHHELLNDLKDIKIKAFGGYLSEEHATSVEEDDSRVTDQKRKSEEYDLGNIKRIKEELMNELVTLEEADYEIKLEAVKDEYEKKQEPKILTTNKETIAKEEFMVEVLNTVEIRSEQTKSILGRILCFSDALSNKRLKLLTHPTLVDNFAPNFQFVKSRATSTSEQDILKVFHVVLHLTNLSEQDTVVEKETILGTATIACEEDFLMKGRSRSNSVNFKKTKTDDDDDIVDTGTDHGHAMGDVALKIEICEES